MGNTLRWRWEGTVIEAPLTERLLAPMRRLGRDALELIAESAQQPGAHETYARTRTAVAWRLRGEATAAGLIRRYYFDHDELRAAAAAALGDSGLSVAVAVGAGVWTRLVDAGLADGGHQPTQERSPTAAPKPRTSSGAQ